MKKRAWICPTPFKSYMCLGNLQITTDPARLILWMSWRAGSGEDALPWGIYEYTIEDVSAKTAPSLIRRTAALQQHVVARAAEMKALALGSKFQKPPGVPVKAAKNSTGVTGGALMKDKCSSSYSHLLSLRRKLCLHEHFSKRTAMLLFKHGPGRPRFMQEKKYEKRPHMPESAACMKGRSHK
eukprot:1144142-Pelagomonas_calceolata.AAC.4